jgi:hypothetical protein
MSEFFWDPANEQIQISLSNQWRGEVTVTFVGGSALRAVVTLKTSGSDPGTTTTYSSCGETGTTVPGVDGALKTIPESTDTTPPYFPMMTIRPLFKAGPCSGSGVADLPFVAPNERTLIADSPVVKHEVWRFFAPDGGIVEVIIVIKDEGAGGTLKSISDYTRRVVNAAKGSRPKKLGPHPDGKRELVGDGEEAASA